MFPSPPWDALGGGGQLRAHGQQTLPLEGPHLVLLQLCWGWVFHGTKETVTLLGNTSQSFTYTIQAHRPSSQGPEDRVGMGTDPWARVSLLVDTSLLGECEGGWRRAVFG